MKRTPQANALTDLILEVFRLNGQLLFAGDLLTEPLGLTSARWQVLGAIDIAGCPLSVAQIARRIGSSRQGVQRIANDLDRLGFISFNINPDHARAKLVVPTAKGRAALKKIDVIQARWSNGLASGLDVDRLTDAADLLGTLVARCKGDENPPTK